MQAVFAPVLGCSKGVWSTKPHRCDCWDREGCIQLGLLSSTGAEAIDNASCKLFLHQCWVAAQLYGGQNLTGVTVGTEKAVFNLAC